MSKPLTDWEVGQDLIAMQEEILERVGDFKDSHPEAYKVALKAALDIGDFFNGFGSHGFGIASHKDER